MNTWLRDLGLGARFAVRGGREGWARTLLTGVGVGLGVALLLVTAAIPGALGARDARADARGVETAPTADRPGRDTLLLANEDTTFRDREITGRLLRPEGPDAPLPPGLDAFPAPGEMLVSPALERLLAQDGSALLRERLPDRITGTIGAAGLVDPHELAFYAGGKDLKPLGMKVVRITGFADDRVPEPLDATLVLLVVLAFTALLTPVAVFIAAAVRFGGERRDRRLAALRLVGADARSVRRVAAGEALTGTLCGLVLGAGFFLLARRFAGAVELYGLGVFPDDLAPSAALVLLVALAVPVAAVAVTLLAMRSVVVEPLGVVRVSKPPRRRLWWRLLLPLAGLALLYPLAFTGGQGTSDTELVTAGILLLLVGVTALLPWLVETVVARLGGGGVAWQLAVRRLQLSGGTVSRPVGGIAVAVAGAIALQMVFTGVEGRFTADTGQDPRRAALSVEAFTGSDAARDAPGLARRLAATEGVAGVTALTSAQLATRAKDPADTAQLTIGDCAALREVARLPSCRDGDAFVLRGGWDDERARAVARPGRALFVGPVRSGRPGKQSPAVAWTVPAGARDAEARDTPGGGRESGVLVTPAAAPKGLGHQVAAQLWVRVDPAVPDALDRARTAVARTDPHLTANALTATRQARQFVGIRTGLLAGAVCVLLLIGASLLVTQLEQLRERRRLLAALVAFGAPRSTLGRSVLWQTALPVALGLALATAAGLALGAVLQRTVGVPFAADWRAVATMAGAGAGVVLVVTLLSLPPLVRLMRPEGLRTE
ncbi:FtsX-like permease family protein [Streptomyces sp. NPDC001941]|uniref:FtsX-like permease family protein n=1 Tax=Streptomyces sp. NPDC001941 TaxID=3154659 RepID=UPI00333089B9